MRTYKEKLIEKIKRETQSNKLLWTKNITKTANIFTCRQQITDKKFLILELYSYNNIDNSYLEIKMSKYFSNWHNNGKRLIRLDLPTFFDIYSLIVLVDYKHSTK